MNKSQSVIHREKGNTLFCSSSQEGVGSSLKTMRLKDAIKCYQMAKSSSSTAEEKVSAAKNIGIAAKKLVGFMIERNESSTDCKYYYNEAIQNLDLAYRFSSCKSNIWVDNLIAKYHETIQDIITYYTSPGSFEFNEMANELESFIPAIEYAHHIRCDLCIEIAQLRFNEGISQLGDNDYKQCLHQIKECHRPVEEARKYGQDLEHVMQEVRILEKDIFLHECVCRSHQARFQGDEMLEKYVKGDETLNMGMVWTVVDLYKEAVILTRENDPEGEAIALSRLGSIFDKVMKDKFRAKPYLMRSIQMAMSLHPRTFDSEAWFKDARETLERYQQEFVRQEDLIWNTEREQYVKELEDELKIVKEMKSKGKVELLQHIYKTYPPRWKDDCTLPDPLPDESAPSSEWKPIFKSAVIHYHPDKVNVDSDGKKWKVLCEEIFKLLSSFYEDTK